MFEVPLRTADAPLQRESDGTGAAYWRAKCQILERENASLRILAQDALDQAVSARHDADHDKDTRLFNKAAFEVHYGYAQKRITKGPLKNKVNALVFLDGDGLKAINDTYGHKAGDAYLAAIAAALEKHSRDGDDVVVRIGGDEFGTLLIGVAPSKVNAAAKRLADAVRGETLSWNGNDIPLHVSMGVVPCRPGDAFADKLHEADKLMYENKRARKAQRPSALHASPATAPDIA